MNYNPSKTALQQHTKRTRKINQVYIQTFQLHC